MNWKQCDGAGTVTRDEDPRSLFTRLGDLGGTKQPAFSSAENFR